MTVSWILGALAAGGLLGLGALAAERIAGWFRLPRRWVWAAAMAGSLLLPTIGLAFPGLLPAYRLPRWAASEPARKDHPAPAKAAGDGIVEDAAGSSAPSRDGFGTAAVLAWLAASLATAGVLGWSQRRLRAACGPCEVRGVDGVAVEVCERAGPMVLGLLRPRIVLPRWVADGPEEELRLIVRHEREHLRAGDPWLLALGALAVAAMPWSVALWWQHRRLRLAVETDCDARVLAAGESRGAYGRVLLRTAECPLFLPAPSLAWGGSPSHLERRIMAMTALPPRHRVLRALPLAAIACALTAAACSLASGGSDAATAADTRETRQVIGGDVVTVKQNHDGTESVSVLDTRAASDPSRGSVGFSWGYDLREHPIDPRSGPPYPKNTVYPQVRKILPGSAAEQAGLMVGDVILASNGVDGRETPLAMDVHPGAVNVFRVRRGTEVLDLRLVVGPHDPAASGYFAQ